MKKMFAEKEIRKIIAKNMTKEQRTLLKSGERFVVHIHRHGHILKKWGLDNNNCHIWISGKNMKIEYNSLDALTWNNDIESANNAISYFVYGDEDEYAIAICAIDNPTSEDFKREENFRMEYED